MSRLLYVNYNITLRFFCIWVRVDRGYKLTWVQVDLVRVDFEYELTVKHVQDTSKTPLVKSINSLLYSFGYGPRFGSIEIPGVYKRCRAEVWYSLRSWTAKCACPTSVDPPTEA